MLTPETFERSLQNYDSALSVRWGHVIDCWVVERRCSITRELYLTLLQGMQKAVRLMAKTNVPPQKMYMLQKVCEEGYSAGYGKRVIIYTKYLDNRVFDALLLTDLQATGNIERSLGRYAVQEAETKRARHNEYESIARETVEVVDWASRKHSTAVEVGGKAPHLIAEAFHREAPRGARQHFDSGILDAQGVSLGKPRNAKVELAVA